MRARIAWLAIGVIELLSIELTALGSFCRRRRLRFMLFLDRLIEDRIESGEHAANPFHIASTSCGGWIREINNAADQTNQCCTLL